MTTPNRNASPVDAKAILVDPATMSVLWLNESAAQGLDDAVDPASIALEQLVPMGESLGVADALRAAAATGVAQHLSVNIVATSKGAMAMVVSIYSLPDGKLLILTDNTWQARRGRQR